MKTMKNGNSENLVYIEKEKSHKFSFCEWMTQMAGEEEAKIDIIFSLKLIAFLFLFLGLKSLTVLAKKSRNHTQFEIFFI